MWYVIVAVAVVLIIVYLYRKGRKAMELQEIMKGAVELLEEEQKATNIEPNPTPDRPTLYPRGGWIVVRADRREDVVAALDMTEVKACNWDSGATIVSGFRNERVLVSGSVDGWVFLTGRIPEPDFEAPQEGLWQFLVDLSAVFGDAQYYFWNSTVMVNAWARAVNGEMVRAYCFAAHEEEPIIIWNDGAVTEGERKADAVVGESGYKGVVRFEEVDDHPDCCLWEEAVSMISEQWSVNPDDFYARDDLPPSAGFIGYLQSLEVKRPGKPEE